MAVSLLTHPLSLALFQTATGGLLIAFTPPTSYSRYLGLFVFIACISFALPTCITRVHRVSYAGLVAGHLVGSLLQYVDKALLRRWDFASRGPGREREVSSIKLSDATGDGDSVVSQSRGTMAERLAFGYHAMFSFRDIGHVDEARNVPPFSTSDPRCVPSKKRFLMDKIGIALACYLVVDLLTSSEGNPQENPVLFSAQKVPLFWQSRPLSGKDLVIRLVTTMALWLSLYCFIQFYTSAASIFEVVCGIDEVGNWRPAFGSPREAYTIRRFWGIFWHQFQRQRLTHTADFITLRVMRLQKGSWITRYSRLFVAFLVSGIVHALTDVGEGYRWATSGSIRFFLTHWFGILIEDTVQDAYCYFLPPSNATKTSAEQGGRQSGTSKRWARWVGRMWLAAFLVWSTPAWIYPVLRVNLGEKKDVALPFSFVKLLKGMGSGGEL